MHLSRIRHRSPRWNNKNPRHPFDYYFTEQNDIIKS